MRSEVHTFALFSSTGGSSGSALTAVANQVAVTDDGTGLGGDLVRLLDGRGLVRSTADDNIEAPPEARVEVTLRPAEEISGIHVVGPWGTDTVAAEVYAVADRLLARLTRHQLDRPIKECRLHAGVVIDAHGDATMLLGWSGSGKSTLVAHLVHSGFDLLNDEQTTVYRTHAQLGGFTRPVAIKADGHGHLPSELSALITTPHQPCLLTVTDLNPSALHRLSARPVLSVVLGRDHVLAEPGETIAAPDAVRVELVAPAEAFTILCNNSLDLVRKPADALADLAWLAATVPTVRLVYGEARAAARAVAELLDQSLSSPRVDWTVTSSEPVEVDDAAEPAIVAAAGTVLVQIGDEAFVFEPVGRQLVALTGAGLDLWRVLPWSAEVPPAMRAFVEPLVDAGVVLVAEPPATRFREPGAS